MTDEPVILTVFGVVGFVGLFGSSDFGQLHAVFQGFFKEASHLVPSKRVRFVPSVFESSAVVVSSSTVEDLSSVMVLVSAFRLRPAFGGAPRLVGVLDSRR